MRKLLTSWLLTAGLVFPISIGQSNTASAGPALERAAATLEAFVPVTPVRVLDTRIGLGAPQGLVGAGETITLQLGGVNGIPDGISGVVMNVTSTQSSEPSFITVWPAGLEQPDTSNLNTEPGQNTPNLVVVGVSAAGAVEIFNGGGTVHLAADVTAYTAGTNDITPLTPSRILDSRDGTGTIAQPFGPGRTRRIQVHGQGGVPADAAAVIINLTSSRSTDPSFITVWPSGDNRPDASTLNTEPGQNTPNLAIVAIGQDGTIDVYNDAGSTDIIADVMGYIQAASNLVIATPSRFLDTRDGTGANGTVAPLGAEQTIDLQVAGTRGIPEGATAVVVNVTSARATSPSFVTGWPTGETRPNASTLNTEVGQNTPNLAVVKVGTNGRISLFNSGGSTDLIVDVAGWFVPGSAKPLIDDLDFFRGEGARTTTDFGLSRLSSWRWNPTTRVIEASTLAGAFATAEDFSAYSRLYTPFGARRQDAELTYDIDWEGTLTSFVGAAAATEVTITIRVYKVITSSTGPAMRGEEIWDEVLVNTGVGAGLQVVAVDEVSGNKTARRQLPDLDAGTPYRVEVELLCNTRVTFSIGATACDFTTGSRGVTVNDWALEYGPES